MKKYVKRKQDSVNKDLGLRGPHPEVHGVGRGRGESYEEKVARENNKAVKNHPETIKRRKMSEALTRRERKEMGYLNRKQKPEITVVSLREIKASARKKEAIRKAEEEKAQAKLKVSPSTTLRTSQPNDPKEKEADEVSEKVTGMKEEDAGMPSSLTLLPEGEGEEASRGEAVDIKQIDSANLVLLKEDDSNNMYSEYGEDVVRQWNKNFSSYSIKSDKKIIKLHGKLFKLIKKYDKAKTAYNAINSIMNSSSSDKPGDQLRSFKAVYDAIKEWMPYIPGFYEYLTQYSVIMGRLASGIDKIAENIRSQEEGVLVLHPGAWPGGWPVFSYMRKLMKAKGPLNVPDSVISWVKKNYHMLHYTTGEKPPAKIKSLFGVDFLWPDKVDKTKLKTWFFNHRDEIKKFIYGNTPLELDELIP